ncbi:MAG: NAD-dependent epimerase/dehydratase family protein, partial [Nitriliruptoraceae bacterium]
HIGVIQSPGGLDAVGAALADGADVVVHAAATASDDLDLARRVNRDGTRRVAEAARSAGVPRLVHVSTTSVYDRRAAEVLDEEQPLEDERGEDEPAPAPYALTKAEAEREVAAVADDGLSAAILRPPAVLGAGPSSTWGTRIPRRLLDGRGFSIPREQTFGWVAIDDLVDAVVAAANVDAPVTVNVVGGHTTVGTYLDAVLELLPRPITLPDPDPEVEPWRGRYAADRLPALLGVTPSRSFATAMAEIAADWSTDAEQDRR